MYFRCGEGHLTISASFSQTEPANQMTQPMYSLLITYKRMPNRQLPVTAKRVSLSSEYQPKHSEMLLLYVCTRDCAPVHIGADRGIDAFIYLAINYSAWASKAVSTAGLGSPMV